MKWVLKVYLNIMMKSPLWIAPKTKNNFRKVQVNVYVLFQMSRKIKHKFVLYHFFILISFTSYCLALLLSLLSYNRSVDRDYSWSQGESWQYFKVTYDFLYTCILYPITEVHLPDKIFLPSIMGAGLLWSFSVLLMAWLFFIFLLMFQII